MKLNGMQVAVVGGGIGGVAAAAALAQRGAEVTVHEQASAMEEVGAGLQISANGQRVLRALGVEIDSGYRSSGTQIRDGRRGRDVAFVPAPAAGPTRYMHRADLLAQLVSAAEMAGVKLNLGRVVTPGVLGADLIVAADGGQSIWRSVVDGPVTPEFTGQVAWRALVPLGEPVGADQPAILSMGSRAHVVTYPLRGGRMMNIVAVEERSSWNEEGWRQPGTLPEFQERFSDFRGEIGALIARAEQVHLWALHLRPVAQRWVQGQTVLLGDAAHPTLPFMAQGACLALEDAWVLAAALSGASSIEAGLAQYQDARQARATAVVALARGNAWRFHLPRPWSWAAQAGLALAARPLARRLEWVYGYDATQVVKDAASNGA